MRCVFNGHLQLQPQVRKGWISPFEYTFGRKCAATSKDQWKRPVDCFRHSRDWQLLSNYSFSSCHLSCGPTLPLYHISLLVTECIQPRSQLFGSEGFMTGTMIGRLLSSSRRAQGRASCTPVQIIDKTSNSPILRAGIMAQASLPSTQTTSGHRTARHRCSHLPA